MLTRKEMQFALIFLCTTVLVSEERKARKVSQYQEFYSDIDLSSIAVTQTYNGYTVVEIGNTTFENNTNLTSISSPQTINSIVDNAFHNCTSLLSVSLPFGVKTIGFRAFLNLHQYI